MANKPNGTPQNTETDKAKQLLDTLTNKVSSLFVRLGFHFIALMTAVFISKTVIDTTFPYRQEEASSGSMGALVYLSLLVVFPRRNQPVNSAIALLTSLIWCFFGPWQIALAWGAAQRILLDIIETKTLFHWRKIGTLFLCSMIFIAFTELNPIAFVPGSFFFLFGVCTVLGLFAKPFYERHKTSKTIKPLEKAAKKPVTEDNSKNTRLETYEKLVDKLLKQRSQLPENLAQHVTDICQQTQLIMHSMETDPRDFEPGDKFLKRYLVAVQKIMDQSQKLFRSPAQSLEIDNALQESESLLIRLSAAFTEQQARLLENDMQDLTIELNVLDKLLKMEGYK